MHGSFHVISEKIAFKIPYYNLLYAHHITHHINPKFNLGFGDIVYDFLFGTLNYDMIQKELNQMKERLHQ